MRERNEEGARRADALGDLAEELDRDRSDAAALELCGDQTHGLVAGRSDRDEQGDIDPVLDEEASRFGRGLANEASRRGDRAHERKVPPIERADDARGHNLARAIEREDEVGVGRHSRMVERGAPMSVDQRARVGVCRNLPEAEIAAADPIVEGLLAGEDLAGARHECQAARREGFCQRRPRDGIDAAPRVGPDEDPIGHAETVDCRHRKRPYTALIGWLTPMPSVMMIDP